MSDRQWAVLGMSLAVLGIVITMIGLLTGCATPVSLPPPVAAPGTELSGNGLRAVAYTNPPTVTGAYAAACSVRILAGRQLPDPACTPGSIAVGSDQAPMICRSGWTETVRPSSAVTERVKTAAMRAYRIPESQRARVELDHLVPLVLGGSNDVTNLWPQLSDLPGVGFLNSKDAVESALGRAVCAGKVDLATAQRAIALDWTTARAVISP